MPPGNFEGQVASIKGKDVRKALPCRDQASHQQEERLAAPFQLRQIAIESTALLRQPQVASCLLEDFFQDAAPVLNRRERREHVRAIRRIEPALDSMITPPSA